jgi:ABC-2 type transport system ATP-binding protein
VVFLIYTENLTKVFDERIIAVDHLNLEIPTGEIFGFLGPNGAGKTTTARLLSCILEPTEGEAVVAEYSIRDNFEEVRKNIGFLGETPSLYDRLSTQRNLELIGRLYGLTKEKVRSRVVELAKLFDFEQYLETSAGKLSKGNKHKVAIARAMIHEPKVLFLDEPTSSLDPEVSSIVRETIEQLTSVFNCTVFICTHNLPEAQNLCDRVGIINKGSLITVGSPEKLRYQNNSYSKLKIELVELNDAIIDVVQKVEGVIDLKFDLKTSELVFKTLNSITTVPFVIKEIVSLNGAILSVTKKEKSLEDIYFELIGRRNA